MRLKQLMKHIIIFTLLLLNSVFLYTQELEETNDLETPPIIDKGLYIETDLIGYISPMYNFSFNLRLFYRFTNEKPNGVFWSDFKTDVGVENKFKLEQDIMTFFVDFTPSRYFTINGNGSIVAYFRGAKRGFVGFDDNVGIESYQVDDILNGSRKNALAIEIEVTPTFKLDFLKDIFINTGLSVEIGLSIKYAYTEADNYYYDYELFLIRKNSDISYKFDTKLVFDMEPVGVGIQYTVTYIQYTKLLGQTIGAYIDYDHYFFDNTLYVKAIADVGQYIDYPNLSGTLYFSFMATLGYKLI